MSSSRDSLVSVIVPGYNCADFIGETLRSAVTQTHPQLEIIFVDDNSTDDTERVVRLFAPHVRYLRGPGQGVSVARNHGIASAHGELLAFLDHDDQWSPTKIQAQLEVLRKHPDVGLVATRAAVVGDPSYPPFLPRTGAWEQEFDGHHVHRDDVAAGLCSLLLDNLAPISSVVVRRSALPTDRPPFRSDLRLAEDYEFLLAVAAHHRIAFLPQPLTTYNILPGRLSARAADMQLEALAVFRDYRHRHAAVVSNARARLDHRETWLLADAGYHRMREGRAPRREGYCSKRGEETEPGGERWFTW